MNGDEYVLTDEQKAAMQDVRNQLGPDGQFTAAHKSLIIQYPALFQNTGASMALVRYNWSTFVAAAAKESEAEEAKPAQ
jgi:hypothetical protein